MPFLSHPALKALEARGTAFTSLAAWSDHRFQMVSGSEVIHVDGQLATGKYFATLGISPVQGRFFTEADDGPVGGKDGPVVVIGDRFWNRHSQRSPSVVGSNIVLDRIRFTVIGVAPQQFFGAEVGAHPDVWIPLSFSDKVGLPGCLSSPSCWWLTVIGRMKPGVAAEQANAPAWTRTAISIGPSSDRHSNSGLSVLLVAAAGLFGGSLFRLLTLNYGFNPDHVSLTAVDTDNRPEKPPALANLYARILERANELPGVEAASLLSYVPLSGGGWGATLRVPGKPALPQRESEASMNLIGPRFFDVLESQLIAGRQFNETDTAAAEKVGIINRFAARRFFPQAGPIGQHILLENQPIRIVGVAGNMKYLSLRDEERPEMYIPFTQYSGDLYSHAGDKLPSLTFVIKTRPGAPSPNPAFRTVLQQIAPDVPIEMTYTMEQQVDSSLGRERLMASLSVFFGTLALLLTSIGLYGTLAYNVTRRTGEIGIRIALGARRTNVIWLVLRGALAYVSVGVVVGTLAVSAASRVVASFLYGVQPNDPSNLAAAIVTLLFVAALAAVVPSLRASRIDPALSLRQE